jgi:uncharacterized protein YcfJ
MKRIVYTLVALSAAAMAGAQETGRVLSSTPVIGQLAVPQQVCRDVSVVVPGQRDGTGAALGAVTGAVIGSTVGHGGGRAAASVIGMVGGAVIGDQLAGHSADRVERVRQCTTHTAFAQRVLHYDVVYEYAGRRYAVQMPDDPGPTLQLQVTPVGMVPPAPASPPPMATITPMQAAPTITTIHTATEYVPYNPYAAPVRITPIVIGLPGPGWGHAPRRQRHHQPHLGSRTYPRHPGQDQRRHGR